jgi:outer membrane protein assembly factor BamD
MNPKIGNRQALLATALGIALLGNGCLLSSSKKKTQPDANSSAEPDKILYDRADNDMKHGRYTVARLSLQTLINTYPDSEYLAKAKLEIADSYYKEGGSEGLLQSVAEYKDFITFFPFLDEAPYAQMQVAMAHFKLMEKPDRDRTEAHQAEDEFQTFLLKYPKSPLVPKAEQYLRDVQEMLAEGDYRIAHFYYVQGSPMGYRAAAARLLEMTNRYPLYSKSDSALWMIAEIYERSEKREIADQFYARIVRDYPLSPYAGPAKDKLVAAGLPVPPADPNALARMKEEAKYAGNRPNIVQRSTGFMRNHPDIYTAAHEGTPNLSSSVDTVSATDVLRPGAPVPANVSMSGGSGGGGRSSGENVSVEAVGDTSGVSAGSSSADAPPRDTSTPTANTGSNEMPSPQATAPSNTGGAVTGGTADTNSSTAGSSAADAAAKGPVVKADSTSASGSQAAAKDDKLDSKTESTSKKKKGWHKLIPW